MATATLAARVAQLEKTVSQLVAQRMQQPSGTVRKSKKLKALSHAPLRGLPVDLSENTRQKTRDLILSRHAANR